MVASKLLSLAMETEEERRARLENDAATKWLRLAMETDKERKARLQTAKDGSYHTAQVGPGDRGRKKSKKRLDTTWIEIGIFKNNFFSRNELARKSIFSS